MTVVRVTPVLTVSDMGSACERYKSVFGMREVMNHGWIVTLAETDGPKQLSLMTRDLTGPCNPTVSIEVDDVDAAYSAAVTLGVEIVHELTDEEWGVRRFFFRDSDDNVINVLSHL